MSTTPISMNTTIPNAQAVNPQTQIAAQKSETPKVALQKPATDKVTISKQAVLMNSKTYSPAEEAQESPADKAFEKTMGQR